MVPQKVVTGTIEPGPSGYAPVQTVTGTIEPGPSGFAPVPQTPTPHATPSPVPHQVPQKTPSPTPQMIPQKVATGTIGPGPSGHSKVTTSQKKPTHHIVVVNNQKEKPITSGAHPADAAYNLEIIEPGIQNKEVAVYRSNDAREMLYKDTITMDHKGYLLIDIGTRDPDYVK
jgi:hypothetical protein